MAEKMMLGKKIGMTQLFDDNGILVPVTVVETGPCKVVGKKNEKDHGYNGVVLGFIDIEDKKLNKPDRGLFAKLKLSAKKILKEFTVEDPEKYDIGQDLTVDGMFEAGDMVDVSGISKGHGFQGTIKKYGQSGGPETHGSMYHRRVGSMGSNTTPARVFKGKRLPGHMGAVKRTVQNLKVVRVDAARNLLIIRGPVPGAKGALLTIKSAVKAKK